MGRLVNQTVSQWVYNFPGSVDIFNRFQIDINSQAGLNLFQIFENRRSELNLLLGELERLEWQSQFSKEQFADLNISSLIDYLIRNHHSYIRERSPVLINRLNLLADKHAERVPELIELRNTTKDFLSHLLHHLFKEEQILFPRILDLEMHVDEELIPLRFVSDPIKGMEMEHKDANHSLAKIRRLTNHYKAPDGACLSFQVAFDELKEFDLKLQENIYVENEILFLKVRSLINTLQ